MKRILPSVLVLSLSPSVPALAPLAQGTATVFGSGCGSPTNPTISFAGSAEPGGSITVSTSSLPPGSIAVLLAGGSDTLSPFGPLPLPLLAPVFAPGCALLTSANYQLVMPTTATAASLSGTLAPTPSDYHVYFQVLAVNATLGWSTSAGLDLHVLAPIGATSLVGTVAEQSSGAAVPQARVTLFLDDLSFFRETRTDATGSYSFAAVPPGIYRLGVARRTFAYEESAITASGGTQTNDFALLPETEPGSWTVIGDTLPETLDATDIGVLRPDGTIFYCHDTTDPILFDPRTGDKTIGPASGSPQGCMNGTLLADGSVLLAGGQDGASPGSFTDAISWVKHFRPNDTWLQLGDMLAPNGRWYPGLARLADGRLLVMGGGTAPSAIRTETCEILDPTTQTWTSTDSMSSAVEFPPAVLLYDGRVLRTWGTELEVFDPASELWSTTGPFVHPDRGFPGHSDHSLLVLTDGRALAVGINTQSEPLGSMTEYFDPATDVWTAGTSPDLRRMQTELVYLPDGSVLVQGGDAQGLSTSEPTSFGIVKRCDLLDPTSGAWRRVADTPLFREYHAVTLLLPDGRVCTTGGTVIKFQPITPNPNVDAYSPPYLSRGVRPRISGLSDSSPARGQAISFQVFPETRLTHVVLMGLPSTTHWVDGGIPRRLELPVAQAGATAQVVLPSDPNLLPLGWVMLFGMVDDVPSEALIARIDP